MSKASSKSPVSPLRRHAADALRRACKLPVGHDRNDLRQLAMGLLWLEKRGLAEKALQPFYYLNDLDRPADRTDSSRVR